MAAPRCAAPKLCFKRGLLYQPGNACGDFSGLSTRPFHPDNTMKTSQLLTPTLREAPAEAEVISHQLMLRAGLIRQLAAGIYTWLPLGLRVLRKVERVVREEMDAAGAQEIMMPAVQPAELWRESGRWEKYGPELLRLHDRHEREFCFGPTHEEIITDLARREIRSYKQLPVNFYQIQTKFRDEIRPRFGIMRAREFLMKDAYSFHLDEASLARTYEQMYQTYCRIFSRLGLKYRAVLADSGNIGGNTSHEFHVLADSGEDVIAFSAGGYAANLERAEAARPAAARAEPGRPMQTVDTPGQHTIEALCRFLNVAAARCLKTLIVKAEGGGLIALALRGDHSLNRAKAEQIAGVMAPLCLAGNDDIKAALGCDIGSIGPVNLAIPLFVDHAAAALADFVCGANENDKHLLGVNWGRDLPLPEAVDIRAVQAGDRAPDGSGPLTLARGIEVGHIFQLGREYSRGMRAACLDQQGKSVTLAMGCYGIGISRIVAAAIEQNHDLRGIVWPARMAPFQLALIPINMQKSQRLREAVGSLYGDLRAAGVEVLLYDKKERPGVMFADAELIGVPHRLVFSEPGLDSGELEYKARCDSDSQTIALDRAIEFIRARLSQ